MGWRSRIALPRRLNPCGQELSFEDAHPTAHFLPSTRPPGRVPASPALTRPRPPTRYAQAWSHVGSKYSNGGNSMVESPYRTLKGFSTGAQGKMYDSCPGCPCKHYEQFYDYYMPTSTTPTSGTGVAFYTGSLEGTTYGGSSAGKPPSPSREMAITEDDGITGVDMLSGAPLPPTHSARTLQRTPRSPATSGLPVLYTSPHTVCPPFDSRQWASAFNQPLSFDTSKVTTMSGMFQVRSFPCPVPNLQSSPRTLHRLCTHSAPARRRSALRPCPRALTLFCPKPELYYSCSAPCKCLSPKIMQRAPFSLSFGAP